MHSFQLVKVRIPAHDVKHRCGIYKQNSISDEVNFDLGFNFDEDNEESIHSETDRFVSTSKGEQHKIMDDRHRDNTKRATKNSVKILKDYLCEKNFKTLEELTNDELPDIFFEFCCNLRKAKGSSYKLQTLKCIRAEINRYTKSERNLDIITDDHFKRTNEMFKAVSTKARKEGKKRRSWIN